MNRKSTPVPEPIAQLQRQLDQFRSNQPTRTKLPEPLWQAAVELARQYGLYAVAHPLRLDYVGLKKRLGGSFNRQTTAPAFVELVARHRATGPHPPEKTSVERKKNSVIYPPASPPSIPNIGRYSATSEDLSVLS